MVHAERVRQAREMLGWTQSELASRLGVDQSTIAYVEAGRRPLSDRLADVLALQTGFPLSFFGSPPLIGFPAGSLLYRSRASLSPSQERQLVWHAHAVFEMVQMLMRGVRSLPLRIPELEDPDNEPGTGARVARSCLGLAPDAPVAHLVNSVERAGIFILALPLEMSAADAFSAWVGPSGPKPVVITLAGKPNDRLRFSIAHELGHLILHRSPRGSLKQVEKEANEFAGEFLLPERAMREELATPVTLTSIASLKRRWGVSMQALIMRASGLGIITDRQKKYLFQQLTARGWRQQEPGELDAPPEKPRALGQLAELQFGRPVDCQKLASAARLPVQLVRSIMTNYAVELANGGGDRTHPDGEGSLASFKPRFV